MKTQHIAETTIKTCGCGVTYTPAAWALLPFVGVMRDDVEAVELRNCSCASTIAVSLCIVEGCTKPATWACEDLRDYCNAHAGEWLMAEASTERREIAA